MNFRDIACRHLAAYKTDVLKVNEPGLFRYRGRDLEKGHILPFSEQHKNIIEPYRDRFWRFWESGYSHDDLHRYFHHLNSSQALCFNLFYPLIAESSLAVFLDYLGILAESSRYEPCFEKASTLENARRKTSFDFYVRYADASEIFVEVKYTEDGFGEAAKDSEHRQKFKETYLHLVRQSAYLQPDCADEDFFLTHYQLLRNLVHITAHGMVVLLFPKANKEVLAEACLAQDRFLTEQGRARLRLVYLEDLLPYLERRLTGQELGRYYRSFREKYLSA